ncbi:hypothetical protein CA267_008105 [Alteromonas pelagimontana]|uniref:Uncharacterized protein n=1 Tax=Alteromonas pelagimontana TaxID=1858656 RepID=A0A6M4MC65_9ALTE|nr:hypothetical protein [Alteromonas pelagimontana]QJR80742.1 hypothetical protein CA267_008105 [Alteromonas pelagimontana]
MIKESTTSFFEAQLCAVKSRTRKTNGAFSYYQKLLMNACRAVAGQQWKEPLTARLLKPCRSPMVK